MRGAPARPRLLCGEHACVRAQPAGLSRVTGATGDTPGYAVLLRGVNVGGGRKVLSADLRAVAEDAGFAGARTLLNSGNLVVAPGTSGTSGPTTSLASCARAWPSAWAWTSTCSR
ncbi:DUF1697 domain-containing protein [Oerskovia sp. M15]